jgi:hypothetical protein
MHLHLKGVLRLVVFAVVLIAAATAHASVQLTGSCTFTASGGSLIPKMPHEGFCMGNPDSPLREIVGGGTTAAGGSAEYSIRGTHGDLGFALTLLGFASRDGLERGQEPGFARGGAGAELRFDDTILVASSTLPLGTEVDLAFSGTVSAVASLPQADPAVFVDLSLEAQFTLDGAAAHSFTLCRGRVELPCDLMFDNDSASFSSVVHAKVGDVFRLAGSVDAFIVLYVDSTETWPGAFATASFETPKGVHTYLTPSSTEVFLVAQSGTDYTAPIPEPATYALMAGGLGIVLIRLCRRTQAGGKRYRGP